MSETRFRQYLAKHFSLIESDYSFFLKIMRNANREER
jgi:hypothetical protein